MRHYLSTPCFKDRLIFTPGSWKRRNSSPGLLFNTHYIVCMVFLSSHKQNCDFCWDCRKTPLWVTVCNHFVLNSICSLRFPLVREGLSDSWALSCAFGTVLLICLRRSRNLLSFLCCARCSRVTTVCSPWFCLWAWSDQGVSELGCLQRPALQWPTVGGISFCLVQSLPSQPSSTKDL